ncbi:MAG: LysR family transcriptional regulator [Clostridia bacterium]
MANSDELSYRLAVRIFRGEKCFGPGLAQLLRKVSISKSLRSASTQMHMAYSKAWRIVKESETALGFALLSSQTGGKNGGGAALTPQADELLAHYDAFLHELGILADELFEKHFG